MLHGYSSLSASLISCSTVWVPVSILSNTFSADFLSKPSETKAINASNRFLLFEEKIFSVPSSILETFPLRSMMTRWAVLVPIPLIFWMLATSSERMACAISSGVMEESMMSAVLGPMPETLMRCPNISRSSLVAKPYRIWASSRTISLVCNTMASDAGNTE